MLGTAVAQDEARAQEDAIWSALEMDDLGDEVTAGVAPGLSQVGMGTGHTHNACYGCSNSATTHGCGTCG